MNSDWISKLFDTIENESEPIKPRTHDFCLSLLQNSSVDYEERIKIERELFDYREHEAKALITKLLNLQTCPIESGRGYNQTQIKIKLKSITNDCN